MQVREDILRETYGCVRAANTALAIEIENFLQGPPVDRPPLANDNYIDYYAIQLSDDQISEIVNILLDREAGAVSQTGETTPRASHYSSMVDIWRGLLSDDD